MTEVTAGINYLQATKFGYDTASVIVNLVAGQTIQRDFAIMEVLDAEFSASPVSGESPLTVQFTDLSTQDPDQWHWEFGDGDTSDLQNPEHTYTADGLYTVKLTAGNGQETNTEIKTAYIQVGSFGLNEAGTSMKLRIYPNPADKKLNIIAEGFNIKEVVIYSLTGQRTGMLRPENNTIDVSFLEPGLYIVEVMLDGRKVRQKLLVQR